LTWKACRSYHGPEDRREFNLANPHNPTGSAFTGKEFEEFLASVPEGVLVVLVKRNIDYATKHGLAGCRWRILSARGKICCPCGRFQKLVDWGPGIGYAIDGPSCFRDELN